ARRIEDRAAPGRDVPCQRADLRAGLRAERDRAESHAVLRERVAAEARVRLLEPDTAARAEEPEHGPGVAQAGVAETRHERAVERPRPPQVVDVDEDMVNAAGRRDRGRRGRTATAT